MVPEIDIQSLGVENLPADWEVHSADSICSKITKGTTPPKSEISELNSIPFLRVNNLSFNGEINTQTDTIFVSETAHKKLLARSIAYPGDVLMNIVGPPLGKIALLDETHPEYNMNQAIVIYRVNSPKVNKHYFFSYLKSTIAQQWLQSRSKKTSGQQNLTIELCKGLPVPVPPLAEQTKIAQILSTWDKAITTTERLLANSQQQKQALMQQLLTGQKRFAGFTENWSQRDLLELAKIKTGKKDVNEGNPNGEYPFFTCAKESTFSDSYSFDCEALLIAGNGAIGTTHYYNGKFEAYQRTYVLSAFNKDVDPCYLHQYILLNLSFDIDREKQHSAMPYIKLGLLQNFKVNLPSLPEQQKIAQVLSTADAEISNLQAQLAKLKLEKKALMQQLLTGQRRVKLDAEAAA